MHQTEPLQHRSATASLSSTRLAVAQQQHRDALQHIQALKNALRSTVSATHSSPPQQAQWQSVAFPPSRPPSAWPDLHGSGVGPATSFPSGGVAVTPAPTSTTALMESQREVEQLVAEKHRLQRQCVELASWLGSAACGGRVDSCTLHSEEAAHSPSWCVKEAAVAVVKQVALCYPDVLQGLFRDGDVGSGTRTGGSPNSSLAEGVFPTDHHAEGPMTMGASHETPGDDLAAAISSNSDPEEVSEALQRLADLLPQIASTARVSELLAEAGPDMLDHIHALEEEKQTDYLSVLSITDNLVKVNRDLKMQASEKEETITQLRRIADVLMDEKAGLIAQLHSVEAAQTQLYQKCMENQRRLEEEVSALHQEKEELNQQKVVAGNDEEALGELQAAICAREAETADVQQELQKLNLSYEALRASSISAEEAYQKQIQSLEDCVATMKAEALEQTSTVESTRKKIDALSEQHGEAVSALKQEHQEALEVMEKELRERERVSEEQYTSTLKALATQSEEFQKEKENWASEREAMVEELQATKVQLTAQVADLRESNGRTSPVQQQLQPSHADPAEQAENSGQQGATLPPPSPLSGEGKGHLENDGEENEGEETGEVDSADVSGDIMAPTDTTDTKRMQQSLKRLGRERTALVRKLERRGTAVADLEMEVRETRQRVEELTAQNAVLLTEIERLGSGTQQQAPAHPESPLPSASPEKPSTLATIQFIDFAQLEASSEMETYPAPIDFSEWLHDSSCTVRFSEYTKLHLSASEQDRLAVAGPLYHIGSSMLIDQALFRNDESLPLLWKRFFIQIQKVLESRVAGTRLSVADSARCFYSLVNRAGLSTDALPPSDSTRSAVVVASLAVCLGAGEVEHHSIEENPAWVPATWSNCCAILQHVCATDAVAGTEEAAPPASLSPRELLMDLCDSRGADGGRLALAPLLCSGLLCQSPYTSQYTLNRWYAETAAIEESSSAAIADPLMPKTSLSILAPLLLCIARYEYLLYGSDDSSVPLSLEAVGIRSEADVENGDVADQNLQVLLLLETVLLPAVALTQRVCPIVGTTLCSAYWAARHRYVAHWNTAEVGRKASSMGPDVASLATELVPRYFFSRGSNTKSMESVPPASIQWPAADYEKLHLELLSLYETNDTYFNYIQQLLSGVESVGASLPLRGGATISSAPSSSGEP